MLLNYLYQPLRTCLLVGLAIVFTTNVSAATIESWKNLDITAGMPSNKVLAVAIDQERVWAGTDKGLVKYDNGKITVLDTTSGLPFPVITSLSVDKKSGDVWVGTMGGLARYSAGRIDTFTQLNSGLANDVIYGLAIDKHELWVATAAGLNRYNTINKTWELFDTANTLMHEPWCYAVTTNQGAVYVAIWGGGIVVRDAKTQRFREHRDPDGEMEIDLFRNDGLVHDVTSAVSVANGIMWAGTYFGLSRYDGRHWQSYNATDSGLAGDFINFVKAQADSVWIATDQGLSLFATNQWYTWQRAVGGYQLVTTNSTGVKQTIALANGPGSNTIYALDVDADGIWLATAGGLSYGKFKQ